MKVKHLNIALVGIVLSFTSSASAGSVKDEPVISELPSPTFTVLTTPPNGDLNPYGVAFVPKHFAPGGLLHPGDIIVSNFNDSTNVQGTGTTIISVSPEGQFSVFFSGTSPLGLTTALGVLSAGFVLVGDVPTDSNGVAQQGALLVIDRFGNVVETLTDSKLLDGPWDLAIHDEGDKAQAFVTNVLSGTVTRIDFRIPEGGIPIVVRETQIASGYLIRTDPAALVVGPTGLAFDAEKDILYVASTGDNEIFSITKAKKRTTDAGKGNLVYRDDTHLHGPLGLVLAPNGHLIASNGDAQNPDPTQQNEIVEFTATGQFVAEVPVDLGGAGAAFGIVLAGHGDHIIFAAVDDNTNSLKIWRVP